LGAEWVRAEGIGEPAQGHIEAFIKTAATEVEEW
jgi:hypothetical protein